MSQRRVYMDYNATTPLREEVRQSIIDNLDTYGNASSMHFFGREAGSKLEEARKSFAALINSAPDEIIFTGGGSESNNAVLKSFVCSGSGCNNCPGAGRTKIVTTAIEHPSVQETAAMMASTMEVIFVGVDPTGRIKMRELEEAVDSNTALVSVIMANNEIGTIQDIEAISKICAKTGSLLHADAVQAVGKIPVDVKTLGVDFLSFSAHKIYGPKGVGGLYIRKGRPFCALINGGHQEAGRRAGTYNAPSIIAAGVAARCALRDLENEIPRVRQLKEKLMAGILASIPDTHLNGNEEHSLPNTLNISFRGAEGEAILLYLDLEGVAVSTGSACASGSLDPSHVLLATGLGPELAHGSIRFSLGKYSTEEEVDYVLEVLPPVISKIRKMSTVYGGIQ